MTTDNEHNGMKVGDIITTYHSGFHKLIRIERRFYTERDVFYSYKDKKVGDEYSPIFVFTKVADAKGNITKGKKEQACDSSFCKLAVDSIEERLTEMEEIMGRLLTLQEKINEQTITE